MPCINRGLPVHFEGGLLPPRFWLHDLCQFLCLPHSNKLNQHLALFSLKSVLSSLLILGSGQHKFWTSLYIIRSELNYLSDPLHHKNHILPPNSIFICLNFFFVYNFSISTIISSSLSSSSLLLNILRFGTSCNFAINIYIWNMFSPCHRRDSLFHLIFKEIDVVINFFFLTVKFHHYLYRLCRHKIKPIRCLWYINRQHRMQWLKDERVVRMNPSYWLCE